MLPKELLCSARSTCLKDSIKIINHLQYITRSIIKNLYFRQRVIRRDLNEIKLIWTYLHTLHFRYYLSDDLTSRHGDKRERANGVQNMMSVCKCAVVVKNCSAQTDFAKESTKNKYD